MELPKYNLEFNKHVEHDSLDSVVFEENAVKLVDGYCRFIPSLRKHMNIQERLNSEEMINYNEEVARVIYGPRILELFKNRDFNQIMKLAELIKNRLIEPKKDLLNEINLSNLALVLVRPEARFLTENIKSLLIKNDYEVVLKSPVQVSLNQYWLMYNDGFLLSDLLDFPTRTLIYTQGESELMVLRKNNMINLQKYINSTLKGHSGIPSEKPTLRGYVVLEGYEAAKKINKKLFYDTIDPLGMYRAIKDGRIKSNDRYYECEDPVLYYSGQGVHLPEQEELATAIGILLNKEQLEGLKDIE